MSYRIRVSVQQLALMLRALRDDQTLDVILPAHMVAQVTDSMEPVQDAHGRELTALLQAVLQEQAGEQVVHSLVI